METRSRFAWARFVPIRFDWEGITIAAFLAGYVVLGGVVFAKVQLRRLFFIN